MRTKLVKFKNGLKFIEVHTEFIVDFDDLFLSYLYDMTYRAAPLPLTRQQVFESITSKLPHGVGPRMDLGDWASEENQEKLKKVLIMLFPDLQ